MDEPVESPFTPFASHKSIQTPSKLIIEMPFNNDITFPIPAVPGETVGDLRRRIATTIGVDSSRVIISQTSPALQSDLSVQAAAEDNKLQLVVRSAFDFEKLRQLIEADRYSPIHPPELKKPMPSPLNSPELGHGFPWRASASLVSPRRQRPPPRNLRIKLENGATVEFDSPNQFQMAGDTMLLSPELHEKLRQVGIDKEVVTLQQELMGVLGKVFEKFIENYRDLRARGFHQVIAVSVFLTLVTSASRVPQWIQGLMNFVLLLGFYLTQFYDFNLVTVARLPPVYAENENVRDLIAKIPAQYKDNEDTSPEVGKEICNAMRIKCGWFGVLKILVVSLFPTIYESWVQQVVAREDAHRAAIVIAAKQNQKQREEREKAEQEREQAEQAAASSLGPTFPPAESPDPFMHPTTGSPFRKTPGFLDRRNQASDAQSQSDSAFSTGNDDRNGPGHEPDRNPFSTHNLNHHQS